MRTPEQCKAKAADLEREARASKTDTRRQAFLELADHWRRLADMRVDRPAESAFELGRRWPRRASRVN